MFEIETITGEPVWPSPDGAFDYVPGILWVKPGVQSQIQAALGIHSTPRPYCGNVELTFDPGNPDANGVLTVMEELDVRDEWVGQVWPEYAVSLFNHSSYFPARPRTPAPPWNPAVAPSRDGDNVHVGLIDLGFLEEADWGDHRPPDLRGTDLKAPEPGQLLSPAIGHAEAAASVIIKYAPDAVIHGWSLVELLMANVNAIRNSATLPAYRASDLAKIVRLVTGAKLDMLVITSGFRVKGNVLPDDLIKAVDEVDAVTEIVAAAGNEPGLEYWPASHERVLGVQARENETTGAWRIECYSSTDRSYVSGPGTHDVPFLHDKFMVDLSVHRCVVGTREPHEVAPLEFAGGAKVSGTSFAAPAVAGVLASHMDPGAGRLVPADRDGYLNNRTNEGFLPA